MARSLRSSYHYLFGLQAPYALTGLPVILSTLGGIGLLTGPVGLLWMAHRREPRQETQSSVPWTVASSVLHNQGAAVQNRARAAVGIRIAGIVSAGDTQSTALK